MFSISKPVFTNTQNKKWSDYDDDDLLPVIPWAPHIKSISYKYDSGGWSTVKSKKNRK